MHKILLFALSCSIIHGVSSQYISFQQQAPLSTNVCKGPSNTSLVEHFFNLIFSEFHHHPPVCVCVQMCPNQPTYCFPNGCFKKAEPLGKKTAIPAQSYQRTAQVSQLQQDNTQPMSFLVDGQSSFMENLYNLKQGSKYDENNSYKEMHRDPFKDRYQSIFKYKKTPKIHLRYNLREQAQNQKSTLLKIDKIDVSKTRWPAAINDNNKHHSEKDKKDSKYFRTLESGNPHYPSKFFKRDVTRTYYFKPKKENFEVSDDSTDITTFSLENLIENLIESSFGPLSNDTELDLNVKFDLANENNATSIEAITMPYQRGLNENKDIIDLNGTTYVVSINNTNQNIDENRYGDDDQKEQIYKDVFNDMIASLSRNIDKNNNSSIEMMEHALGNVIKEISSDTEVTETTLKPSLKDNVQSFETPGVGTNVDNSICETTTQVYEETPITEIETTATEKEMEMEPTTMMRKSHRRLLRKPQNNKPN